MIQLTQLARRALPLLVLALAAGACDRPDPTEPLTSANPIADAVASPEGLSFASSSFRGGIPFGTFHLPQDQYGNLFNGSLGNIYPKYLPDYLATAKRNGTKLILNFGSAEYYFIDKNGKFSMSMWKKQVDRFRGVNITPYIQDGTIVGHYLIDEPYDPVNWGGKPISKETIDEMGKYSKQIWPTLPTVVRAYATWMKGYRWKYVDAAWAQYSARHGPVSKFLEENVRDAKAHGLALVVGFNQLAGGGNRGIKGFYSGRSAVGASELEDWGSVLLAHSYPCAFISWKYDARYQGRSDIKSALNKLAQKARSRSTKSCRGSSSGGGDDDDDEGSNGGGDNDGDRPSGGDGDDDGGNSAGGGNGGGENPDNAGSGSSIKLSVTGRAESQRHRLTLTWSGASGRTVDVYRNGSRIKTTENDNRYTNLRYFTGRVTAATYVYKLCERGSSRCSNEVTVRVN
jgi:hypothetical protein